MTNPTLIDQDTPWRGWTTEELQEKVLGSRGLTLDATTGRTLATTQEQADALEAIKQALALLQAEFPSLWVIRTYETTWTSGDHSIALPKNVMAILGASLAGKQLTPMKRDDWYRLRRSDDAGGDIADSQAPTYYRVTGFSDEDTGDDAGERDWRIVVRLHPVPSSDYAGETFSVDYIALGLDVTEVDDPISLFPHLQGWVFQRAKELWAADNGDVAQAKTAEAERAKHERPINVWIENASRESQSKATWTYPRRSRRTRYRRM